MITPEYLVMMAAYNQWQNQSLMAAADSLSLEDRVLDRGAFFGSISRTFSHVLWGDQMWLSRFQNSAGPYGGIPESPDLVTDWAEFKTIRSKTDLAIIEFANKMDARAIEGDLTWYSGAIGREISKPRDLLLVHMFNHQTHHRGQIHAMLTAAGTKPEDTDIPFMPASRHPT